ncbi:MAG: hypothetical protein QOD06_2863 [Candidatus Binatota bacterium]|nr:hypothetical protein [Candidatus Binatota bacterium]
MARLTLAEFGELVEELVEFHHLGMLREKLLRSNTVVSQRVLSSPTSIAHQLYQRTAGLGRDGLPTQVVLALWEELLGSKIDEESSKKLEEIADRINGCLTAAQDVDPAREQDLRSAIGDYRTTLAERAGDRASRLTMLTRAVPAVARVLRES